MAGTPISRDEALARFKAHAETADRIHRYVFTRRILYGPIRARIQLGIPTGPMKIQRKFPSNEAIDAFVLNFRLFWQKNDLPSLPKIKEAFEHTPGLSFGVRLRGLRCIRKIEKYLEQDHEFGIVGDPPGIPPTPDGPRIGSNASILHTFLYGQLAHQKNNPYRIRYKSWTSSKEIETTAYFGLYVVFKKYLKLVYDCLLPSVHDAIQEVESKP